MRRTAIATNVPRAFLLTLLLVATLFLIGATATPVPPIEPSSNAPQPTDFTGLIIAILSGLFGGSGLVYWVIKKLIDNRVTQIQQEYSLKVEQLRSGNTLAQIDADRIKSLADSIQQMASVVHMAYQAQSQQDIQALAERKEFRGSLDGNTNTINSLREDVHSLYETINGLTPMLVTIVEALSKPDDELLGLLNAVRTNIGNLSDRLNTTHKSQ